MPAVGARDQPVVHGLRVAERAALGDLDRVDVADQVADAGVGRRELLAVPLVAVLPGHRQRRRRARRASRRQRTQTGAYGWSLISQPVDDRRPLVEQAGEGADQPGLALAALAEQDEVVAGEQRALEVGQDGVVEADDAGETGLAGAQPGEQVVADLGLDGAVDVAARAQLAEIVRLMHGIETTSLWDRCGRHFRIWRRFRISTIA